MKGKIISVTEKEVAVEKENGGNIYFELIVLIGSIYDTKATKVMVFMPENDIARDMQIEAWRDIIATGKFPPIDMDYFVVGDPSMNPNDKPLPPFQLSNPRTGELDGKVRTALKVLIRTNEKGVPVERPRNVALRIIERSGTWVEEGEAIEIHEDPYEDHEPEPAAPVSPQRPAGQPQHRR